MHIAALQFQYLTALPWVILLLAVSAGLLLVLYQGQVRQMPASRRWLMPALRMLAISAVALSILRPVITRQRVSTERAPVVIVFDNSHSMSVAGSARSPAELVSIAAALGRLPANARDKQTLAMAAACDLLSTKADDVTRARAELDYARLSGRGEAAAATRLDDVIADLQATARDASSKNIAVKNRDLERPLAFILRGPAHSDSQPWLNSLRDQASKAAVAAENMRASRDTALFKTDAVVREACQPLATLSRLQIAETIVFDSNAGLLARLGSDTSVLGFGISDQVTPIAMLRHQSDYDPLAAEGVASNITGGIRAVLESLPATPRAVILFSDGRQTGADLDIASATTAGVPIFAIGTASRSSVRDLSILNVDAPSIAFPEDTIVIKASIRGQGFNGTTTALTLTGAGQEQTRSITFTDDRVINIQFVVHLTIPGKVRLMLDLTAVPGEMSIDNNHIQRWITVRPRSTSRPADARPVPPATHPSIEAEMANLNGDDDVLQKLADASAGRVFRLDQLDAIVSRIALIHGDANHPVEIAIWDGPYLPVLVLGCLAAEWGLRKRNGLA